MFYSRFQHLPSFVSVLPFNSARCPDHTSPIPPNYLPLVHLKWPPLAKLSSFIPPNRITVLKRRENVHLFSKALLYLNPFLHPTRSLYSDPYYFPSPTSKTDRDSSPFSWSVLSWCHPSCVLSLYFFVLDSWHTSPFLFQTDQKSLSVTYFGVAWSIFKPSLSVIFPTV